jgi:hypothetical protein
MKDRNYWGSLMSASCFTTGLRTHLSAMLISFGKSYSSLSSCGLIVLRSEFTKGLSIQDENLLEVVLTRNNVELKAALDVFTNEYGTPLKDVLAGHSYKNYRDFMSKVRRTNIHCSRL